ncbi:MAG: hypothetical protein ACK4UR_05640, partial [Caldimicrobium sp.]
MGKEGRKAKWYLGIPIFLIGGVAFVGGINSKVQAKKAQPGPATEKADVQTCYTCHSEIKDFHLKGKHKNVNCG